MLDLRIFQKKIFSEKIFCSKIHFYQMLILRRIFEEEDKAHLASSLHKKLQLHWVSWCNYIQNNFSWKALWALPPNLLRFHVGATYNTLPCPSNLVRWNETKDPSCSLCGDPICTIRHVLSGCSFSLKEGRWNFRHDSVLLVLLQNIESLIITTKSQRPASQSINFVKPGYVSKRGASKKERQGLIHKAKDWVLLADIGDTKLIFPTHIACTEERPDILLFSNQIKTSILIENSSGCEETANDNHNIKLGRYDSLCEEMRRNGWVAHLFPIEVNARGYCSKSVLFCLKSLGFQSAPARKIVRQLGETAMKASFTLWLARDNKLWKPDKIVWKPGSSPVNGPAYQIPKPPKVHNLETGEKNNSPEVINTPTRTAHNPKRTAMSAEKPIGIRNLGQTCYANVILQLFQCNSQLLSSLQGSSSPVVKALLLFKVIAKTKQPFDPKLFLAPLATYISKVKGKTFRPNSQHDAAEVFGYILNELTEVHPEIHQHFGYRLCSTIECNQCAQYSTRYEDGNILQLQLSTSIAKSILSLMAEEPLTGLAAFNCPVCDKKVEGVKTLNFSTAPQFLFLQLMRFVKVEDQVMKKSDKVMCSSKITVAVKRDGCEEIEQCSYSLVSVVSHIGSYTGGHYTFQGLNKQSRKVWLCDDSIVQATTLFEDRNAYILVYQKE